jgi:phytoene synthase
VDDIADSDGPRPERLAALQRWRDDIDALYRGHPPARLREYVASLERFKWRREDFLAIVDGMEMDVPQDIRAPDLATLDLYCDRVASAVGRLSVKIFGMEDAPGFELAYHLGRALQLINILRDLDEDASFGRLYLPREFLNEAGISSRDPNAVIADPEVDKACRKLSGIAHEHYAQADRIMRERPRGLLRAPRLMGAVYGQILSKMEAAGWAPPRERVRIGRGRLLLTLLRYGLAG